MNQIIAQNIIDLILESEPLITESFQIAERRFDTYLSNFHNWAANRKNIGAFRILDKSNSTTFWFLFIEWNPNQGYYLIIYPENKSGPLVEIHEILNNNLHWKYSPAKRDGKNNERKEYFERYFYSLAVEISIPEHIDEVEEFIRELFQLTDNRLKSDRLDLSVPIERMGFPEGKRIERKHYARERNSKLIQFVKAKFKKENGKLFCQVCEFDFENKYGERGIDFIEAHHTRPLHELDINGEETTMDEIALVCSNCHKIIHRTRPWLDLLNLKKILKLKYR